MKRSCKETSDGLREHQSHIFRLPLEAASVYETRMRCLAQGLSRFGRAPELDFLRELKHERGRDNGKQQAVGRGVMRRTQQASN